MSYIETSTGSCDLPTPSAPGSLKSAETTRQRADTFVPTAAALSVEPDGIIDMPVSSLRIDPQFSELFGRSESVVGRIATDMRVHGYDRGCPIVVTPDRVVLDGHTRLEAARRAGLTTVKVVVMECQDDTERLEFAIKRQRDRRNLSDGDILSAVQNVDRHFPKGGAVTSGGAAESIAQGCAKGVGRSSQMTANLLGISSRRVEQARQVLASKDAVLIDDVIGGRKTINAACTGLKRSGERRKLEKEVPQQAISRAVTLLTQVQAIVRTHCPELLDAITNVRSQMASVQPRRR